MRKTTCIGILIAVVIYIIGCAVDAEPTRTKVQVGMASWYGKEFHGRRTAYGERFDRSKRTLASRSLPHNTRVRVTFLRTGKSCIARVNDYGPYGRHSRRIADLSEAAAADIGLKSAGVGRVQLEILPSAKYSNTVTVSSEKPALKTSKSLKGSSSHTKTIRHPRKPSKLRKSLYGRKT